MNPEEMLDLRNQELKVDEDLVNQLIVEAKADYSENLLEPIWALTHPKAVKRHRARFGRGDGHDGPLEVGWQGFAAVGGRVGRRVRRPAFQPGVRPGHGPVFYDCLHAPAAPFCRFLGRLSRGVPQGVRGRAAGLHRPRLRYRRGEDFPSQPVLLQPARSVARR